MASSSSTSMLPPISSSQYTILSFDLYGTLLDFQGGIYPYLTPLLTPLPSSHPYRSPFPPPPPSSSSASSNHSPPLPKDHPLLSAFSSHETSIQNANPTIAFEDVLRNSYKALAEETGAAVHQHDLDALVQSSREWPPFPDTVAAMKRLKDSGRYKFIAISNNSASGLKAVLAGPLKDVRFDRAYSAEEVGSYKPDVRNFEKVLEGAGELGAAKGKEKESLLHVAHGVGTDQTVCEELGIRHVWVERGADNWGAVRREEMRLLESVRDAKELAGRLFGE